MQAHRLNVRNWLLRLVREGGRGWHDYAKAEAARLVKEDATLHGDLKQAVQHEIDSAVARMREGAPQ